jgi:hypothetical protein
MRPWNTEKCGEELESNTAAGLGDQRQPRSRQVDLRTTDTATTTARRTDTLTTMAEATYQSLPVSGTADGEDADHYEAGNGEHSSLLFKGGSWQ